MALANALSFPRSRWCFLRSQMHRISGLPRLRRPAASASCIWERRKRSPLQKCSPSEGSLVENDPKKPSLPIPQPASALCPRWQRQLAVTRTPHLCTAGIHTLQPHSQEADAVVQLCTRLEAWGLREIRPERNFHKMRASGWQPWGPALLQATQIQSQLFHYCHPNGPERAPVSWRVL